MTLGLSSQLYSEELEAGEILTYEANGQKWRVHYITSEDTDKIKIVEESSKIEMSFSSDSRAHSLIRVEPLNFGDDKELLFATIWSKGAHGETIRVLNPRLGNQELAELFYYHSAWPLEFAIDEGDLLIKGKGDMDDRGVALDELRTFTP